MSNKTINHVYLFVDMDGTLATWQQAACFEDLIANSIRKHMTEISGVKDYSMEE